MLARYLDRRRALLNNAAAHTSRHRALLIVSADRGKVGGADEPSGGNDLYRKDGVLLSKLHRAGTSLRAGFALIFHNGVPGVLRHIDLAYIKHSLDYRATVTSSGCIRKG